MGLFGNSLPKGTAATDYNTPLMPEQQAPYQQWRAQLPSDLQNNADYDLQGAYLGGAATSSNAHLPDTWKKPNHMTYSDGSQYNSAAVPAGHWADTGMPNPQQPGQNIWNFWASQRNVQEHQPATIADYFRQSEQGNNVFLPYNYRLPQR